MTDAYLGEIQLFSFPYAPVNWASCNGQLLPIQRYTALFSLLGTYYGGDGRSTFALPNLNGFAACSQGQGPGLSLRTLGENFGEDQVSLNLTELPPHTHAMSVYEQPDTTKRVGTPQNGYGLIPPVNTRPFLATAPNTSFAANTISPAGNSLPHLNQQPFLVLNYCICLQGIFPSFS